MVTMSTVGKIKCNIQCSNIYKASSIVGYGDVVCVTALGRGFQVLFLLVGLVS